MADANKPAPDAELVRASGRAELSAAPANAAMDVLRALPPEAIVKAVEVIGDVIRARTALSARNAEFLAELEVLRTKSADRERVMTLVSNLLLGAVINDEAKMKLVDTICQLALR